MQHFSDIFELFDDITNMVASFEDKPIYKDIKFCDIINANQKVLEKTLSEQSLDYLRKLRTDVIQKYKVIEDKYEAFINVLNAHITAKTTDAQKSKTTIVLTESELNTLIEEAVKKATANK